MRSLKIAASTLLAVLLLSCTNSGSTGQAPATEGEQVSAGTEESTEQASSVPLPKEDPEATVAELYTDETFFHVRNAFPAPMVKRFSRCFTPELIRHFESHNEHVARWKEEHDGETLKLPMSEGPIFSSNYEGANSFSVGQAKVDGAHAEVPVTFSYTAGADTVQWVDIVMLRRVDGLWLMDDIQFDPERFDNYTLRERVSLDE